MDESDIMWERHCQSVYDGISEFDDADAIVDKTMVRFFEGWEDKKANEILFARTAFAYTVGKYYKNKDEMFRQLNVTMYNVFDFFLLQRACDPDFKKQDFPINFYKTKPRSIFERIKYSITNIFS